MEKAQQFRQPSQHFAFSDLKRRWNEGSGGWRFDDSEFAGALRRVGRKRKGENPKGRQWRERLEEHARTTRASLRLDGLEVGEAAVVEAMVKGGMRCDLRSRLAQMVRTHVAILFRIEQALRRDHSLKPATVLGWYASLCAGLPTPAFDDGRMRRLEQVCRQINSPPMRLRAAVEDVGSLYYRMLQDPLVPSFNGILARLLLRYHLGRCGLPAVSLQEELDRSEMGDEKRMCWRLVMLMEEQLRANVGH